MQCNSTSNGIIILFAQQLQICFSLGEKNNKRKVKKRASWNIVIILKSEERKDVEFSDIYYPRLKSVRDIIVHLFKHRRKFDRDEVKSEGKNSWKRRRERKHKEKVFSLYFSLTFPQRRKNARCILFAWMKVFRATQSFRCENDFVFFFCCNFARKIWPTCRRRRYRIKPIINNFYTSKRAFYI